MGLSIDDLDETTLHLVDVDYAETRHLEDYALYQCDLLDSIYYATKTLEILGNVQEERNAEHPNEFTLAEARAFEAFWTTALTKYRRSLKKATVNRFLKEALKGVPEGLYNHKVFHEERNIHIAHATNDGEQCKAFVALPALGTPNPSVLYVSAHCVRQNPNDLKRIEIFIELASALERQLDIVIASVAKRACERAVEEPIAKLYRRPIATIGPEYKYGGKRVRAPGLAPGWETK